jgi:predicted acyl esterase
MYVHFLSLLVLVALTAASARHNETELKSFGLKNGFKEIDVVSNDATLKAILYDPAPKSDSEKNPTIIFISSWGMNKWEYVEPAHEYAQKGYTVLSYTSRGFWQSGGEISLAGIPDQQDVTNMITWVIENTNADPARIGLSGISYGGGLSLLGSAMDARVKSAVAMSCWVDIAESFLGNGETIRVEAAKFLQGLAELTGKPSEGLEELFVDYFSNSNLDYLYDFTYNSSAENFVSSINEHNPAVFIANGLGDSLFTPNQFLPFFNELLTVSSKHLEFAPGDHAGPELVGLLGLPDQVWKRAMEWNDFYLLQNHPNTADIQAEYEDMALIVLNTKDGREIEKYNSWAEVTTATQVYDLAAKEVLAPGTADSTDAVVIATVTTGAGAGITGGVAFIAETIEAAIDVQKPIRMRSIDRERAAVFVAPRERHSEEEHYRGVPVVDLDFIPQSTNGSLVLYLLAVDELNFGHLFSFSPWTFKEVVPGEKVSLSIPITVTCYDIPARYDLALVIATQDEPLYLDENPPNLPIQFLSSSRLTMPINK